MRARCVVCGKEWGPGDPLGTAYSWRDETTGATIAGGLGHDDLAYVFHDGAEAGACDDHEDDLVRSAFVLTERTLAVTTIGELLSSEGLR